MSNLTLVYNGLSKRDRAKMESRFEPKSSVDDGFEYPRKYGVRYYHRKDDDDFERAQTEARRERYRELRLAELKEEIESADAVTKIGGIVFEKGKPVDIRIDTCTDGSLVGTLKNTGKEIPEPELMRAILASKSKRLETIRGDDGNDDGDGEEPPPDGFDGLNVADLVKIAKDLGAAKRGMSRKQLIYAITEAREKIAEDAS